MQYDTRTNLQILCTDKIGVTPYSIFLLSCLATEDFTGKRVCDFGCGTGVISLNILSKQACEVIGLDIVPDAVDLSRENARRNQIKDCLYLTVERFESYPDYQHNSFGFDYIISNPASIPTPPTAEHIPFRDGGEEGDRMIVDLFRMADLYLKPCGQVLFLHTSLAPLRRTLCRLDSAGYEVHIEGVKQMQFRKQYEAVEQHLKSMQDEGLIFYFENCGKRCELVFFIRAKKQLNRVAPGKIR